MSLRYSQHVYERATCIRQQYYKKLYAWCLSHEIKIKLYLIVFFRIHSEWSVIKIMCQNFAN